MNKKLMRIISAVMALCLLCGALLTGRKPKNPSCYAREAFVATALGWIVMSAVG